MTPFNMGRQQQFVVAVIGLSPVIIVPRIGQHWQNKSRGGLGMGFFLLGVLAALLPSAVLIAWLAWANGAFSRDVTWRRVPPLPD
jgi:hypothetical protein